MYELAYWVSLLLAVSVVENLFEKINYFSKSVLTCPEDKSMDMWFSMDPHERHAGTLLT